MTELTMDEQRAIWIEDLELPNRAVNAVRRMGLKTAGDLADWVRDNDYERARAPNLGARSAYNIVSVLVGCGLLPEVDLLGDGEIHVDLTGLEPHPYLVRLPTLDGAANHVLVEAASQEHAVEVAKQRLLAWVQKVTLHATAAKIEGEELVVAERDCREVCLDLR